MKREQTEAECLLREARKIVLANSVARNMNKDWLQRTADYFKRAEKWTGIKAPAAPGGQQSEGSA